MDHIATISLVFGAIALCAACGALLLARWALADARAAFDRAASCRSEADRLEALQEKVTRGVELIARAYELSLEKQRYADSGH